MAVDNRSTPCQTLPCLQVTSYRSTAGKSIAPDAKAGSSHNLTPTKYANPTEKSAR